MGKAARPVPATKISGGLSGCLADSVGRGIRSGPGRTHDLMSYTRPVFCRSCTESCNVAKSTSAHKSQHPRPAHIGRLSHQVALRMRPAHPD